MKLEKKQFAQSQIIYKFFYLKEVTLVFGRATRVHYYLSHFKCDDRLSFVLGQEFTIDFFFAGGEWEEIR